MKATIIVLSVVVFIATTCAEKAVEFHQNDYTFILQGGNNAPEFEFYYSQDNSNHTGKVNIGPFYYRLKSLYEADPDVISLSISFSLLLFPFSNRSASHQIHKHTNFVIKRCYLQ